MQNNIVLCIDLVLYGLEPKNIKYVFSQTSLDQLDQITYMYKNAEEFFEAKKKDILNRLKKEASNYDILLPPTDIELGKESIYIEKNGRKILPLFKKIKVKDLEIKIEDLVKKRMLGGNLYRLYECDTKRQYDQEYESVFKNCPVKLLERIALNCYNINDIDIAWEFFQSKTRFYSLVRFLLSNGTSEELENIFITDIPLFESIHQPIRDESQKLERYRYPYIDD